MEGNLGTIFVRRAVPSDAGSIARVHIESWREAYAGVVPQKYLASLDVENRIARWEKILSSPKSRTWIATLPERVLGFASLGDSRDEDASVGDLELYSIYVAPDVWGQGVARELLRTLLEDVTDENRVSLWVLAENPRARHFYRRHGFREDGVERSEDIGGKQLVEVRYVHH